MIDQAIRTYSLCYQARTQLLDKVSHPLRIHLQQWEAGRLRSKRNAVSDAPTHEGVGLILIAQRSHGDLRVFVASGDRSRRVRDTHYVHLLFMKARFIDAHVRCMGNPA